MAAISPEEFYKEFTKNPATLIPEGISKETGHFNAQRVEVSGGMNI